VQTTVGNFGGRILMAQFDKQAEPAKKQELFHWHELRTIVDDAALAISGDPAEHTFYPHADLHFIRAADNL
jgi:hypothetical protein